MTARRFVFLVFLAVSSPVWAATIDEPDTESSPAESEAFPEDPTATEEVPQETATINDSILRGRISDFPRVYVEKPSGLSPTPPGYREKPLNFSQTPPNTVSEPLDYSLTPPGFIEREKHPNVNADPDFLLTPETHPSNNPDPRLRIPLASPSEPDQSVSA